MPTRRARYDDVAWFRHDAFVVRAVRGFVVSHLAEVVSAGAVVVDVGCGEQPLRALVEARGGRYVGVDMAPNHAGRAQVIGDAGALPLRDGAADVVIATEVLEHVPDIRRAIEECARVMKAGGVVVATTPFMYPLHETPHDFVRPTPHLLRSLCGAAGLDVVALEPLGDTLGAAATLFDHAWPWQEHRSARALRLAARALVFGAVRLVQATGVTRNAGVAAPSGFGLVARRRA